MFEDILRDYQWTVEEINASTITDSKRGFYIANTKGRRNVFISSDGEISGDKLDSFERRLKEHERLQLQKRLKANLDACSRKEIYAVTGNYIDEYPDKFTKKLRLSSGNKMMSYPDKNLTFVYTKKGQSDPRVLRFLYAVYLSDEFAEKMLLLIPNAREIVVTYPQNIKDPKYNKYLPNEDILFKIEIRIGDYDTNVFWTDMEDICNMEYKKIADEIKKQPIITGVKKGTSLYKKICNQASELQLEAMDKILKDNGVLKEVPSLAYDHFLRSKGKILFSKLFWCYSNRITSEYEIKHLENMVFEVKNELFSCKFLEVKNELFSCYNRWMFGDARLVFDEADIEKFKQSAIIYERINTFLTQLKEESLIPYELDIHLDDFFISSILIRFPLTDQVFQISAATFEDDFKSLRSEFAKTKVRQIMDGQKESIKNHPLYGNLLCVDILKKNRKYSYTDEETVQAMIEKMIRTRILTNGMKPALTDMQLEYFLNPDPSFYPDRLYESYTDRDWLEFILKKKEDWAMIMPIFQHPILFDLYGEELAQYFSTAPAAFRMLMASLIQLEDSDYLRKLYEFVQNSFNRI